MSHKYKRIIPLNQSRARFRAGGVIRLEQGQILDILDKIEIPPEFYQWTMKQLKLEAEKEIEDRDKILESQQKAYNKCVKRIDNLIDMRANGEITEKEFKEKKSELIKEKHHLKELLEDTDDRVNKWVDKAKYAFELARDAKEGFENGELEKKKEILAALGSNFTLKDKKLRISLKKELAAIKKAAKEVETIHSEFEPLGAGINIAELEHAYSQNPILLLLKEVLC